MKNLYTLLLALFMGAQIQASHIKGGEIYYDYVSGSTYDIYLVLYGDPSGISLPSMETVVANNGTSTLNLSLNVISTNQYILGCNTSVKVYVYKATANLGAIPAVGTELIWNTCCRPGNITNLTSSGSQSFYIHTKMFPTPGTTASSSSARFYSQSNLSGSNSSISFNTGAFDPDPSDSIYVSLIPAFGQVNTSLSYATGYSSTNPFGTMLGNTTLDHRTGLLNVVGASNGVYQVALAVESYYNGTLASITRRDVTYHINSVADSLPSTHLTNISTSGTVSSLNGNYFVEMNASDVLNFDVIGIVNSVGILTLRGYGALLTNNSAGTNCTGSNCMTFTAASGSFSNLSISQGSVSFSPTNTAVPAGAIAAYYNLVFESLVVGSCNQELVDPISMVVKVNASQSIWAPSNFNICQGLAGQVQINGDTTNLHWSPSVGVSDTTSASPYLFPSASTTYTITNLNNGHQITLNVIVDAIVAPNLTSNGTHATIPNYANYDGAVWYYNGVAIAVNLVSVAMPIAGSYFAIVTKGACSIFSDTIIVIAKNQIPLSGTSGGTPILVSGSGTYSMTFKSNIYSNVITNMVLVVADELTLKTSTAPTIEIKNSASQVVYSGTATAIDDVLWEVSSLNLAVNANEVYTMEIVVDAGNIVLFAPSLFPYTENNGVFTVNSSSYTNNGTAKSDAFPFVVFGVVSGIGLRENELSANIYPVPMKDRLRVEIIGSARFEIMDAAGRVLISTTVNNDAEINTSALPLGMYIYKLQQNGLVKTGKLVK